MITAQLWSPSPRCGFAARFLAAAITLMAYSAMAGAQPAAGTAFAVEESGIDDVQAAITEGRTTCAGVVEAYLERVRAYNGVCTSLVTEDGADIEPVEGYVRAGSPITFPTQTIAIAELVPDFEEYAGKTPDFGRMQTTATDPSVFQQFGIVKGIPGIRQVNALETLNIRGERSQTCRAECDLHPSAGDLPGFCPAVCDSFREQPDALERARELDETYGANPDLEALPLYCTVMSVKAVYDTADMRSTGGGDVACAMDAAPVDSTLVARLRSAGAIMFAKAHNSEYNGGSGNPGGDAEVERPLIGAGGSRETWSGATFNPYDTERETGGSSGGSAVSVAARTDHQWPRR